MPYASRKAAQVFLLRCFSSQVSGIILYGVMLKSLHIVTI
jgi:hypothetical protein